MSGILYSVATPIGNLDDITLRALKILKKVDYILTERKSTTLKLLNFYNIRNKLITYREDNHEKIASKVIKDLLAGKRIALVSEAGTPVFSDPGALLIKAIYKLNQNSKQEKIKIVPVPGPNSVATALSALPLASPKFVFMGFTPQSTNKFKKQLETLIPIARELKLNIIFFENSKRLLEHLKLCQQLKVKQICIAKELTKIHEAIICNTPQNLYEYFSSLKENLRGEFILIIKYLKDE